MLSDDGTHYLLNGTKIWISNAGYADLFTVFAKVAVDVDGVTKQRVTAFIVDAHATGVTLGKREEKMGIKASDTRTVFFDNVKVPVEDRLGDVGQGFRIALEVLNSGRLGLAAGSARGARRIMSERSRYAKQREQFGRPIGSFEMIQHKIANNAAEMYAADSAVMVAADMVDRGGIDFSLETAACKVFASELAFPRANDALQIAGGIGYSKEFPYEQAVRDSRINLIFEGTNEILRALVALMGLQQPGERLKALGNAFKDPIHSLGAIGNYLAGRAKRQITKPSFTQVHAALERGGRCSSRRSCTISRSRWKTRVLEARQGDHRAAVPPGSHGQRGDRHLPRDRGAVAHDVGDRARRRRGRGGRGARLRARVRADGDAPCAPQHPRAARNQDARLKAIAERALDVGDAAPTAPTDI